MMNRPYLALDKNISLAEKEYHEKGKILSLSELDDLYLDCEATNWEKGKARCRYLLGQYYKSLRRYDDANMHFASVREIGLACKDDTIIAWGLYGLALTAFKLSNMSDAYSYIKEAEYYARIHNLFFLIVSCQIIDAQIKKRFGEYDAAIIMLQAALVAAKQYSPYLIEQILQNIVEAHLINGEFQQAREYAIATLNLYPTDDGAGKRLNALVRLATIYVELNEIKNAETLTEEAKMLIKSENSIIFATILCLMGRIAVKRRQYAIGLRAYRKAFTIYHNFSQARLESNVMALIGEAYLAQNKTSNALEAGLKALKFAKEAEDLYMTKESLKLLYEANKKAGNIEKAFHYIEQHNELVRQDAIKQFESRLAFVNLKTEQEKKLAEAEEERRKTEALKLELEKKEKDLTIRARNLIKQTEAMAKLRDDLRTILKRSGSGNQLAKQIAERLRALPGTQKDSWNDFEEHFASVHPEFLDKLSERFPELTKMERKLCALLRLNLSSGDMAKLLVLSERNIENHRYRLRKKLSLNGEASLQEFLSTID